MRIEHFPGLSTAALIFLYENKCPPATCETCGHVIGRSYRKQIGTFGGVFGGDGHPLFRHTLKNDQIAYEFLQTTSWSGGPAYFLGLRLYNGRGFIWSEMEIAKWL